MTTSLVETSPEKGFGQPISKVTAKSDRKAHPQTTPPEIVEKVIQAARLNPMWGCCKLADDLKHNGVLLSSPTIQKILIKHHLGTRRERAIDLLAQSDEIGVELTFQQQRQVRRILPGRQDIPHKF